MSSGFMEILSFHTTIQANLKEVFCYS
jgi:hypothetical protein